MERFQKIYKLRSPFFFISTFLILISWLFLVSPISAKPIIWETSILKAMEKAKKENKPIFVELYADWCVYCKTLEKNIFPDPQVTQALSGYIPVRLNGEEYPNFMDRYNAVGFPTLLFLDKHSNFISKLPGMPTKDMVIREAKSALSKADMEEPLLSRWKENPLSIRNNFELGVFYFQNEDFNKSAQYFKTSAYSNAKEYPELKRQALYNLAMISLNTNRFKESVEIFSNYLVSYPNGPQLSSVYLHRGLSWKALKESDKAKKDLYRARTLSTEVEEKEFIQTQIDNF
ncbi:thioredoxin family protein [Leptospira sp. GIMC2001]|uniref:thioredoxin family protein n=1 Tax=Leptospira sp. GIMC2001 TaxID=1513297 RepID=UPI0023493524|nr:thioredoxin family protein [Leptospira sp. GIMC2001]WCL48579.1 thioredoxin family protein [Leptospira sp. GIMC2001]